VRDSDVNQCTRTECSCLLTVCCLVQIFHVNVGGLQQNINFAKSGACLVATYGHRVTQLVPGGVIAHMATLAMSSWPRVGPSPGYD